MASILHFSDIHFPLAASRIEAADLRHPKRLLATLNYLVRRRFFFSQATDHWQRFQASMADKEFDAILCTGDLTTMGTRRELEHARAQIEPFLHHPAFILLPGNHDLYLPRQEARHFFDVFADCYQKPGQIRIEPSSTYPFPFLQLVGDDTAILAINSAKPNPLLWLSSGRVSDAELEQAKALAQRPECKNRKLIIATHYNCDDEDSWRHGLENRKAFREFLEQTNCFLLAHGHVHRSYETTIKNLPTQICCAGSLTYRHRESYRVYQISVEKASL